MAEPIGRIKETAIPSLSDTANIQEALRIYHYGKSTQDYNPENEEVSNLEERSIAFYLTDLQDQIDDIGQASNPASYEKKGNLVSSNGFGPIVLELNPNFPSTFAQNGLLLTSDDETPTGLRWKAPDITLTNIQSISNKTFINSSISSDGLKFIESGTPNTFSTTLRSPDLDGNKTVFFPTTTAELSGSITTLVGTNTIQTLTNKTLTAAAVTDGGSVVGTTSTQTLTNKTLTAAAVTGGGSVVGTTATQTLTNKTIDLEPESNTITGRLDSTNGGTPAGVISQYAGLAAPAGYLLCQGQSVSKITFSGLFDAIGYTYGGEGDNFVIPNLQNRVPVGKGSGTFGDLNNVGGAETVTLDATQMPVHTHIQNSHNHDQNPHGHSGTAASAGSHSHTASTSTEGGHTHGNSGDHRHTSYNGVSVVRAPGVGAANSQDRIVTTAQGQSTSETSHTHSTAGSHEHDVTINSNGSHSHTVTIDNATATNKEKIATNQNAGGLNGVTQAHNNLQPYIVVNYIIKT
jgi:microcystin-dependent protein